MSENNRSVKRRRIVSQHDAPTPSKPASARAGTTSNRKTNEEAVETPSRRGGHGHRSDVTSLEQESPSKKGSVRKPITKALEHSISNDESDESDGEPRRSARKRKPSAKVLFIEKDITESQKPRNTDTKATKQSSEKVNRATPVKAETLAKSAKDTPSKTPKRRGRPSKQFASTEHEEEDPPRAPVIPVETPKKRGRPPLSTKRPNHDSQPDSTPKALRFDIPSTKANGVIGEDEEDLDVEMVDDVQELQGAKSATQQSAIASNLLKKFGEGEFPTSALSRIVLEKLAQRRPIPLTHLDEEYVKVHSLLESTITAGEGNSMLVVGARGSGKTALVNKALSELRKAQEESFHIVRLSGFIQTDDKLALREIWRQLGREMETDEDVTKSYADALTMLLALLSHPDEIAGEAGDQVAKSIIIIMDEFDLFATHARQTLLYNLLDIAQSRKAPIAVLGLTTKFDVTERLEKRVKSRFSHRYVHLPLPKSLKAFEDVCKAAMSLEIDELTYDERMTITKSIEASGTLAKKDTLQLSECLQAWNASVNNLFLEDQFNRTFVRNIYHLTKSVPAVLTSLLMPLSSLPSFNASVSKTLMPLEHFLAHGADNQLLAPTSSLALVLPSLSELQLSLLIAAARLDVIHDSDTCSFGMAYAQYVELSSKARLHSAAAGALATGAGSRVWGRDVARGEWESLIKRGLILPVSEAGGAGAVATVGGLVKVDVRLEEISGAVKGMSSVLERWCKQI